ncbi:MAG: diaminopimelate epimerase [Woeseiaceae bacterium]|nr:diaminopimelate epimerase [Woeseiaceae bacterium]
MRIDYLKMLGAGNQILIADRRKLDVTPPSAAQLRRLGDASTGPGFDQLMWVMAPADPAMDASYRVFNADGSEVEQCGNGVRCVAWMLAREDATQRDFHLESPAGIIAARVHADDRVTVSMGPPEFEPGKVPFVADTKSDCYFLAVGDTEYDVSVLSMGNPHCVLQVADVSTADVAGLGPVIEHHDRFPACTNVGFMAIRGRRQIDLRVHERGVGETLACGTGACAAVVAGQRLGHLDDEVTVSLPGGQLVVSWRGGAEVVWLSGNAELTSEGTIDL